MNISTQNNYSPAFQAYYKSSFSKQFEKTLLTGKGSQELTDKFEKMLHSKMNDKFKMGTSGMYGSVFRLDDYYVFKTYHNDKDLKSHPFQNVINEKFQGFKTYCGNILARFGKIEIMKNATKDKKKFVELANSSKQGEEAYAKSLKEFSALGQKQFDMLAQDFSHLNEIHDGNMYYMFDTHNPNNLLKIGKSLKLVDEIAVSPCENSNDIYAFLRAFIQEGGDENMKKSLFKKCILASEKENLPMESAYNFSFLRNDMDKIFKNAGIDDTFKNFYEKMTEFRSKSNHMQLVEQYLEQISK
jgi:hypothetical protein